MKVIKWLDEHFEEFFLEVMLVLLTIISFVQVIIRKVPFIPALTWAEELCRFAWIASVFISVPYTIRKGNMLRVTVLLDAMPKKLRKIFNLFVDLVNVGAFAFLLYYAVPLFKSMVAGGETSPAMLWPMWIVYLFIPLGFALAVLRGIEVIVLDIKKFNEDMLTTTEQALKDAQEEIAAAANAEGLNTAKTEEVDA